MKAIVLAAGVARRLYPLTYNMPKCMLEVGNRRIIDYQMNSIRETGIQNVTLVVGHLREILVEYMKDTYPDLDIDYVINQHFFETNTAYSMYLCRERLYDSDTLLLNGDVLYPTQLVKRLVRSERESVIAVEVKECGREEVKVIAGEDHRITAIGKELIQENALGEFIGVAKFSKEFNHRFAESLDHLISAGGKADYFEAAIDPLLQETPVHYVDVTDLATIEIDFEQDLEKAQELILSKHYRS